MTPTFERRILFRISHFPVDTGDTRGVLGRPASSKHRYCGGNVADTGRCVSAVLALISRCSRPLVIPSILAPFQYLAGPARGNQKIDPRAVQEHGLPRLVC